MLGRWDEALEIAAEEEPLLASEIARGSLLVVALVHCERAEPGPARALLTTADMLFGSGNAQARSGYAATEARVLRCEGRLADALASAERGLMTLGELDVTETSIKQALVEATEAALPLSNLEKAEELLAIPESLDPGQLTPFLQAQTARLSARLEAARGQPQRVHERFSSAATLFREYDLVFCLAVCQLEHAEWLAGQGRNQDAQPLLNEAREVFERLQATPWLERAVQASLVRGSVEPAIS